MFENPHCRLQSPSRWMRRWGNVEQGWIQHLPWIHPVVFRIWMSQSPFFCIQELCFWHLCVYCHANTSWTWNLFSKLRIYWSFFQQEFLEFSSEVPDQNALVYLLNSASFPKQSDQYLLIRYIAFGLQLPLPVYSRTTATLYCIENRPSKKKNAWLAHPTFNVHGPIAGLGGLRVSLLNSRSQLVGRCNPLNSGCGPTCSHTFPYFPWNLH